jgi:chorismate dehydratase
MIMREVGSVPYLNAKPLLYGLETEQADTYKIATKTPAKLALDLRDELLEFALLPIIEYGRGHDNYALVPNLCIGTSGSVASVLLFFKKDIRALQSVALDASSRTSVALLKIILSEKYGIQPRFTVMEPSLETMLAQADAALLIGDNALHQREKYKHFLDLGEEWVLWTGLPFVFAAWVGREENFERGDLQILQNSLELGEKNLPSIIANYTRAESWQGYSLTKYLQTNIDYRMSEDHIDGIKAFLEMAFYHGLLEHLPDLHFFN